MSPRDRLASGLAVGLLACSVRGARTGTVPPCEARVFRRFNDAPAALAPIVWPVMQMGSLGGALAAAALVGKRSGRRHGAMVAAVGVGVWGGVKLVKPFVGRGRPAAHLTDVHVRGHPQSGLGYPSGHAAVSATIALIASVTPEQRRYALAAAAVTSASRIYVGAHLPFDVVGGAAIGWLVGSAVRPSLDGSQTG